MIGLGIGEIVGGFAISKCVDWKGMRFAILFEIALTAITFLILLATNEMDRFGPLCYLMTVSWGVMDSGLNTIMNAILGTEFNSNLIPFSIKQFVASITVFLVLVIESFVRTKGWYRIWFLLLFTYAVGANIGAYLFKFKKQNKTEGEEEMVDEKAVLVLNTPSTSKD